MIIGQAIDCFFENKPLKLEQLEFLHIHKTAKLIAGSLKMGAIIVNLDKDIQNQLYKFGISLGLLFQIQDDIIDEVQTEEEAGKTTSNDSNKNSFINLLGLEESINSANKIAKECEETLENIKTTYPELKNLTINLTELLSKYLYRHQ